MSSANDSHCRNAGAPATAIAAAREAYEGAVERALKGEITAGMDVTSLAQQYLDCASGYFGKGAVWRSVGLRIEADLINVLASFDRALQAHEVLAGITPPKAATPRALADALDLLKVAVAPNGPLP